MASRGRTDHIILDGVKKTFNDGEVVACEDIDLSIRSDELIVLLGPSGCGKTTTLRSIAGLESIDSGSIQIGDRDVTGLPPRDRDIAFVFQQVTLFPHKSVRENMRFGLDMKTDLDESTKEQRVTEAAELLGIEELLDRKPSELSGGQRQRVSLGRAMVMEPEVFLLDEPFSALDANLRDQMQTEIQRLQHEVEKSMVFVTHDQEEALTIGDRIVVINDGLIQQVGSPQDIYNDPANLFVAEFIGSPSTNIFHCRVEVNDRVTVENDAFRYTFSEAESEQLRHLTDETVYLGMRPARMTLSDADGLFTATVDVVERLGENDAVYLSKDGVSFRAQTDPGRVEEGTEVGVDFSETDVWIFAEDGTRLV